MAPRTPGRPRRTRRRGRAHPGRPLGVRPGHERARSRRPHRHGRGPLVRDGAEQHLARADPSRGRGRGGDVRPQRPHEHLPGRRLAGGLGRGAGGGRARALPDAGLHGLPDAGLTGVRRPLGRLHRARRGLRPTTPTRACSAAPSARRPCRPPPSVLVPASPSRTTRDGSPPPGPGSPRARTDRSTPPPTPPSSAGRSRRPWRRTPASSSSTPAPSAAPTPTPPAQLHAVDERIGAVLAELPPSATVVVASLADAGAQARLQLLAARGPSPGGAGSRDCSGAARPGRTAWSSPRICCPRSPEPSGSPPRTAPSAHP